MLVYECRSGSARGVRPGVLAPDALHVMEKGSLEAMLKEQNFKVGHIRKFIYILFMLHGDKLAQYCTK